MRDEFNGMSESNQFLAMFIAGLVVCLLGLMACVTAYKIADRLAPPLPAAEPATLSPERVDIVIKR